MLKQKLVKGVAWDFVGQLFTYGIQFLVLIVMSRVLLPEDFGIIGLLAIFTSVAMVVTESGFMQALIRKKTIDNITLSSVFYVNVLTGLCLYCILYISAPYIAVFYNTPELTAYSRVLFLSIPINSLAMTQSVLIQRSMEFNKYAITNIFGALVSGIIGVWMAYNGYGVWAIVGQQISIAIVKTLLFFTMKRWIPKIVFSFSRIKELFGFSMNLMFHSLIDAIMNDIYTLVIGKFFSATQVGYYNQANRFEKIIATLLPTALMRVSMSALVSLKNDVQQFKQVYRRLLSTSCYIIAPMMAMLIVIAEPLFTVLLTDKWLPAVPYFQLLCIYGAIFPIIQFSFNVYKLYGKGRKLVLVDTIRHTSLIISIFALIKLGINIMIIGQIVVIAIMTIINMYQVSTIINYKLKEHLKDILQYYLCASLIGALVYILPNFQNDYLSLLYKLVVYLMLFVGTSVLIKPLAYVELLKIIKGKLDSQRGKV